MWLLSAPPTCDSEGYASFEDEVMYLDALVIAQAVHNNGGIVMMQVQKMVKKSHAASKIRAYSRLSGGYCGVSTPTRRNSMAARR
ncbi:propionate CoA-transferase [Salmonella enterica subsp. enterica]|uniref:Propionate CoA-transferase n=1 Tax=Salmonella enterica I TaxID=59201 RepID=A0A3S4LYU4_SALET|nr:propionate CoA-transferase [Salmonella enterica subsp. enterica]